MENRQRQERNIGIDLLRVVSMLMIATLHVLGHGGILGTDRTSFGAGTYEAAWLLEIAGFCGVNCYALISGYVGCYSKFRWSKLLTRHIQVLFYTISIAIICVLISPELVGQTEIGQALFPVMNNAYWYYVAYVPLCLMMPILNAAIEHLPQDTFRQMNIALFVVFCVLPVLFQADRFKTSGGYHVLWLMILYLYGGYIRHYGVFAKIKAWQSVLLCVGCIVITWLSKILKDRVMFAVTKSIDYMTPTLVIASIALFVLFTTIKIKASWQKIVCKLSACTFGVYLIHDNPLIRNNLMKDRFATYAILSAGKMILLVFLTVLLIFVVCAVIEMGREWLFKVCSSCKDKLLVAKALKNSEE